MPINSFEFHVLEITKLGRSLILADLKICVVCFKGNLMQVCWDNLTPSYQQHNFQDTMKNKIALKM